MPPPSLFRLRERHANTFQPERVHSTRTRNVRAQSGGLMPASMSASCERYNQVPWHRGTLVGSKFTRIWSDIGALTVWLVR
jgi:hypothetical protein